MGSAFRQHEHLPGERLRERAGVAGAPSARVREATPDLAGCGPQDPDAGVRRIWVRPRLETYRADPAPERRVEGRDRPAARGQSVQAAGVVASEGLCHRAPGRSALEAPDEARLSMLKRASFPGDPVT